jgi:hypothetical protein
MAQANYETRNAPTLEEGGEPMVTKAIDDFIAYMCADETVKVTDMLIMVNPKDTSKQIDIDAAETAKLLQQLYTEMLVERIMEKGLDYLLRR